MKKEKQEKKNGTIGIYVRALFSGLFSYTNILFIILLCALIYLFRFCVLNFNILPYPEICFSIIGMAFIVLLSLALIKIMSSKGEAGPPEMVVREGNKYLWLINQSINLALIHEFFPKKLPSPDGISEGKIVDKNNIKMLTDQEKKEWDKKDEEDIVKQIGEQLTRALQTKETEQSVVEGSS